MNRVSILLDSSGELLSVAADSPVTVLIVAPHCPHDRVYERSVDIGPQHVQAMVAGYAVGHGCDGTLNDGREPRKPPSRPGLTLVPKEDGSA